MSVIKIEKTVQEARDALGILRAEGIAANRRADNAEAAVRQLTKRLLDTEERLYRPMASALTRYMDVTQEYRCEMDVNVIRIMPNCSQIALCPRDLLRADNPIAVINHHIEKVLAMHSDDLRKQLQGHAWVIASRSR